MPNAMEVSFAEGPVYFVEALSPDFQNGLWFASTSAKPLVLDLYSGALGRPLVHVGPAEPPGSMERALVFTGASEMLTRTLFIDASPNNGEVSHLWPGDTTAGGRLPSLYEYAGVENAAPHLVGVRDQGGLISDCGIYLGSGRGPGEGDFYNAVSASGTTVFFTAPASSTCGSTGPPVNELYARISGESTVAISEPSKADCAECEFSSLANAEFQGASLDGSKVFFKTVQHLLPTATGTGADLYQYDFQGPEEGRVTLVSSGGAGVLGVARVSEDGSHVYFVATGSLTGANREGKAPVPEAPNLYVFSSECPGGGTACPSPVKRTSFVATLSPSDGADWNANDARPVQATQEGRFLVFQSAANLLPDQEGRTEAGQVFEYDAQTETLVRVSRGQNGYNDDGHSSIYPATIPVQGYDAGPPTSRSASPTQRFTGLAVSEDGSRVFFSSEDALTPQALSGVNNVYEYHNGHVGLISDGHDMVSVSEKPAVELLGTDESGLDVFFTTADSLVPQDTNTQVDIYDARINGGFTPSTERAPCTADSCQGAPSVAPLLAVPGVSPAAEEAGAPAGPVQKTIPKKKPVKHKQKAKKGKGKRRKGGKTTGRRK